MTTKERVFTGIGIIGAALVLAPVWVNLAITQRAVEETRKVRADLLVPCDHYRFDLKQEEHYETTQRILQELVTLRAQLAVYRLKDQGSAELAAEDESE